MREFFDRYIEDIKENKWRYVYYLAVLIFLISLIAISAYVIKVYWPIKPVEEPVPSPEPVDTTPVNPIDFDALSARNPDVYAWIKVPGTAVDYAIAQAGDDKPEDYYLNYDIDGNYDVSGTVYSQKMNLRDFTDANTVLYGHNWNDGLMFSSLHSFRDKAFFDEHKYMYIYTKGHILTYLIYAAYRYDNRHILYSFDFNDKQVYADYLAMTRNPKSTIVNEREDVALTTDDRIVTLSTCINNPNYRYLVQGVLIDDTATK